MISKGSKKRVKVKGDGDSEEEEEGFYILSSHTGLIKVMTNQTF